MVQYPRITIFDDSLLTKAIKELKPTQFKLFVYIYHLMEDYDEMGNCCQEGKEEWLLSELGFTRLELVDAFISLRRTGWLDALVLFYGGYDEKIYKYRWWMTISRDEYESFGSHYIETREPVDEWNKDKYIIIGCEWVSSFDEVQRKTKNSNTSHWRKIRKQAIERDGGRCVECSSDERLHVHHLTYENEGREKLEDVITLCQSCHSKKPKRKSGVGNG